MDAPPTQSERIRELAALRSRAYGPDADIHLDEGAVARLLQLEELERGGAPARDEPADPAAEPGPAAATEAAPTAAADPPAAPAAPAPQPSATATAATGRRWWRRVPTWGWIAGAALVGLTVGLAGPAVVAPQPDAVLRPIPLDGESIDDLGVGFDPESQVRFETFHSLEVWSGETRDGSVCVYVLGGVDEILGAACGPEQLPLVADLQIYPMMPAIEGLDLPVGSVVRFVLRDGVVEVRIVSMSEEA